MLDRLKELVRVVSKNKVQRIEIIGENYNYNSLVQRFYNGIHNGEYDSEEQAAEALYSEGTKNANYRQLKYKLEKRLINTLFHIDVNDNAYSNFQKAYYSCHKNLASINILLGKLALQNAISLAERTLRVAQEYEFTNIIVELSRKLKSHYYSKDQKKYTKYKEIYLQQSSTLNAEMLAEHYYQELWVDLLEGRVSKNENLEKAITYSKELKKLLKIHHSRYFKLTAYRVIILRYELINDYKNVIQISKEAIQYFESKSELIAKTTIFRIKYKLISYYTATKRYSKAEKTVAECLELVKEGGVNWYLTLDYALILCLHTKQYHKAYDFLIQAKNHPAFKDLDEKGREIWFIYEAYIQYFILMGKIRFKRGEENQLSDYRRSRFINNIPNFAKDKRGINVAILVIQILFFLKRDKIDQMVDRVDALERYSQKHLRRNDTFRSNCFIKMLVLLEKANFHKAAVLRKTKPFVTKLATQPLEYANQASDIEIVPYEHLWEYVLESLENEFKFRKGIK